MYVNGNPIDISYNYYVNASNSAGMQIYNISMTTPENLYAKIYENQFVADDAEEAAELGMVMPDAVYYMYGTRGTGYENQYVLELSLYSDTYFYNINCRCTGSYSSNNYINSLCFATVFIDPSTGKLVDIEHVNYFYDYASGSNYMLYYRPCSSYTTYLYPYWNSKEPNVW